MAVRLCLNLFEESVVISNVDKNDPNTIFTYWDKESGWYIDPKEYYGGITCQHTMAKKF